MKKNKIIKLYSYLVFSYDVILLLKDGSTRLLEKGEKIRETIDQNKERSYTYKGYEVLNFKRL
ncbi:MAG: hypothetical protein LR005_01570 [Candidatus Pacebacteria bacterium]|nr:hypothetical protein [Candidatus Paceibacterota bacterium]